MPMDCRQLDQEMIIIGYPLLSGAIMKSILLVPCLIALGSVGCAVSGHKVNPEAVAQFKPGVTTKAEAIAVMGRPRSYSLDGVGNLHLTWTWARATIFSTDSQAYMLVFGPDGVMLGPVRSAGVNLQ
jgi:hypothetical protein